MITEIEKAYMAGIIDGEGHIGITKYKTKPRNGRKERMQYDFNVSIVNTNLNLITYLLEKLRNNNIKFCVMQRKEKLILNHKLIYVIQISDFQAENFLKIIYPYLVAKKEQADVAFEFRKTFIKNWGRTKVPQNLMEKREECFQKMKELNRRGYIKALVSYNNEQ